MQIHGIAVPDAITQGHPSDDDEDDKDDEDDEHEDEDEEEDEDEDAADKKQGSSSALDSESTADQQQTKSTEASVSTQQTTSTPATIHAEPSTLLMAREDAEEGASGRFGRLSMGWEGTDLDPAQAPLEREDTIENHDGSDERAQSVQEDAGEGGDDEDAGDEDGDGEVSDTDREEQAEQGERGAEDVEEDTMDHGQEVARNISHQVFHSGFSLACCMSYNFHECHMKEVVAEVGSIRSSQRLWG